jgi:hypothetical protein
VKNTLGCLGVKNANPSINEIHVENDYSPLPSKFKMLFWIGLEDFVPMYGCLQLCFTINNVCFTSLNFG